jgi:hypothetical protein
MGAVADLEQGAQAFEQIAATAQTVGNWVNAGATVVSAGSQIAEAGINYDAAMKQADALDLKADAKKFEAMISQLDQMIDMALSHLMNRQQVGDSNLDAIIDAMKDKGDTLAHAKLKG